MGEAICRLFAKEGAKVVVADYNFEGAEKVASEINTETPDAATAIKTDVSIETDADAMIDTAIALFGKVDILVNNAGITKDKVITKMADQDWYDVINVNLSGSFFLAQAALKHMIERGTGRIVNVSSLIGEHGNIGQANYAASKAGLFGLTKTLAREAAFQLGRAEKLTDDTIGVTINAVTPGYVLTEMVQAVPEKVLDKIKLNIPLRRLAQPEEIARVVHFLVADESSFITGQVWGVNGGQDM